MQVDNQGRGDDQAWWLSQSRRLLISDVSGTGVESPKRRLIVSAVIDSKTLADTVDYAAWKPVSRDSTFIDLHRRSPHVPPMFLRIHNIRRVDTAYVEVN
jgi:hypothetical protein